MPGMRCAVYGCNNTYFKQKATAPKYMFHRFPKAKDLVSKTMRNEWIVRCRREDKLNADTSYICSVHFTENDYERDLKNELLGLPLRRLLKKTAVPTLSLFSTKPVTEASIARTRRLHTIQANKEAQQVVSELLATPLLQLSASEDPEKNPEENPSPGLQKLNYKVKYTEFLDNFND